jgi:hypothetical protein
VVDLVIWRDSDSGPLQVIVDGPTQHRSRVRHAYECFAHQIPRADGFERSETVVTLQDHYQGLLDESTERQPWQPFFPSKKSCVDGSLRKRIRELRRVLARNHHVDVGQLVAQDPQGFWHPPQFVSGQKAHGEAWLGGMSDPACSFGCRFNLR